MFTSACESTAKDNQNQVQTKATSPNREIDFYCYEPSSPIDLNWDYMDSVFDFAKKIELKDNQVNAIFFINVFTQLINKLSKQDYLAESGCVFWEGDFRFTPKVFMLPCVGTDSFLCGFAFKQNNNGTTFICSPMPLPHLEKNKNYIDGSAIIGVEIPLSMSGENYLF